MISRRTIQQVLDSTDVVDVVRDFVNLKKRGTNYVGLCPFHNEKTPSFYVSATKGIYKCFGCGKAGDAVGFLMEHEKISYPEAIRYLAQKYNIAVEETEKTDEVVQEEQRKDSLNIICNFAEGFFQRQLNETENGKNIGLTYFKERGFDKITIEKFKLGYAPDKPDALTKEALEKGYKIELLKAAGLIHVKDNGEAFDFLRGRVVFPIHSLSGKTIAFAGRVLKNNDKVAKYINSPETEIYSKSKTLYGLFFAKNSIRQIDECLLTEGYTDVISLHQAGIQNVVASSGTSLTTDQIKLIKRYTKNITLLYDGDAAGVKAALRGIDLILDEDMNVRIMLIPDGKDPDEFVRAVGAAAFTDFSKEHAKNIVIFKAEILMRDAGNDPVKRAEVIKDVIETIARIPDAIKRSVFMRECALLMQIDENVLNTEVNKIRRKRFLSANDVSDTDSVLPVEISTTLHSQKKYDALDNDPQERDIVRLLLEYGNKELTEDKYVTDYILEEIREAEINNALYAKIYEAFEMEAADDNYIDYTFFAGSTDEEIRNLIANIIATPYHLSENWEKMHEIFVTDKAENYKNDVYNAVNRFKLRKLEQMMEHNGKEIKEAQDRNDADELQKLLYVRKQLNDMKIIFGQNLGTVITR